MIFNIQSPRWFFILFLESALLQRMSEMIDYEKNVCTKLNSFDYGGYAVKNSIASIGLRFVSWFVYTY